MDKIFYTALNGQHQGPFSLSELKRMNIRKDTFVWREGWNTWMQAGETPDLQSLFELTPSLQNVAPQVMTFYVVNNGQQQGPFSVAELKSLHLARETFVWTAGWDNWKQAGDAPELADLFKTSPPPAPAAFQPASPQSTVVQSYTPQPSSPDTDDEAQDVSVVGENKTNRIFRIGGVVVAVIVLAIIVTHLLSDSDDESTALLDRLPAVEKTANADDAEMPSLPDDMAEYMNLPFSSANAAKIENWKKTTIGKLKKASPETFAKYNFGKLWKAEFTLGYIGSNYQRLYVTLGVAKKKSTTEYVVSGFSKVKTNLCDFSGVIKNIAFYERSKPYGEEYNKASKVGALVAEFVFAEDKSQKSAGVFHGYLITDWYIDAKGELIYDAVMLDADDWQNNQFLGEWLSYDGGTPKLVAWGDGRMPLSRDALDIGNNEVVINPKYIKNGWNDFGQ
jgi:hypothetical protein